MIKYTLLLIFTLILGLSPAHAEDSFSAIKAPGIVTPAGERILYYDRTRLMVLDPESAEDPQWLTVRRPQGTSFDGKMLCSSDGQGFCAVGLRSGEQKFLGVFDATNNVIVNTLIEFNRILAVASYDQIFIQRDGADRRRQVFRVNAQTKVQLLIGTLRAGERFDLLPISGALDPVFIVASDKVRFPRQQSEVSVAGNVSFGQSTSILGVFGVNDLFQKYADGADRAMIWRRSYQLKATGDLGGNVDPIIFPLPTATLPLLSKFATDRSQQVLGLSASNDTLSLVALCWQNEEGSDARWETKALAEFTAFTELQIVGHGLGEGFVVRIKRTGENEVLTYVRIEGNRDQDSGAIACSELSASISSDIAIPGSALPNGWIEEVQEFSTSEGQKIRGVLLRPAEGPVTSLIIDVYGASSLLRSTLSAPNDFLESTQMEGTAIFYPILPGDGNLGWDFASSSRAPERIEAVQVLVDVAKQARARLLAPDGKLIFRGGSAGAWLAVKAALAEPDVADEVVAISGAYFFEAEDNGVHLANFFTVSDSISEREIAGCGDTFFRLVHGTEDQITPLDRTMRFAGMMSANNCKGALHIVVDGDHHLADFWDFRSNPEIGNILHWQHGLEP